MKKFLTALFFISVSTCVFADDIKPPDWNEFCPEKFLNAKELNTSEYTAQSPLKFIPPTTNQLEKYNKTVNYWQERKENFDYYLKTCESFPEDKRGVCYVKVRDRELRLNRELEDKKKPKVKKINTDLPEPSGTPVNGFAQQMKNMMKMYSPGNY